MKVLIKPNGLSSNKNQSFELRGSRMYTNCDCWRRNGLQDNCPRSGCQGKSGCMNTPSPNCGPASYQMKLAQITMGMSTRRPQESVMNNGMDSMGGLKGNPEYAPYEGGMGMPQMNAPGSYAGYQTDLPGQPTDTWPQSDGVQGSGNWNNNSPQGNFSCQGYM